MSACTPRTPGRRPCPSSLDQCIDHLRTKETGTQSVNSQHLADMAIRTAIKYQSKLMGRRLKRTTPVNRGESTVVQHANTPVHK